MGGGKWTGSGKVSGKEIGMLWEREGGGGGRDGGGMGREGEWGKRGVGRR